MKAVKNRWLGQVAIRERGILSPSLNGSQSSIMSVLTLIVACLVAVALACPPPLNNWAFVGNETHTTADLINAALEQSGLGWTEAVATYGNPAKPWPMNENGIALIEYCYEDKEAKDELFMVVNEAVLMWTTRLGYPSAHSRHRLYIQEVENTDRPYCYWNGEWNTNYKPGTLVIHREKDPNQGAAARASLGWLPEGEPDRHGLSINPAKTTPLDAGFVVAHELGHVFGLWHEHQREDRDTWLHFECKNVVGYERTKREVEAKGEHTMKEVCESSFLSYKYNFMAAAWSKHDYIDDDGWQWRLHTGEYDKWSIMLYASDTGMDPNKKATDVFQVPLVQWRWPGAGGNTDRNDINCHIIWPNRHPSRGDLQGLMYIYRW